MHVSCVNDDSVDIERIVSASKMGELCRGLNCLVSRTAVHFQSIFTLSPFKRYQIKINHNYVSVNARA